MANFPTRLIVEDFDPKDQALMSKLAFFVNPVLTQVASISNNGLSLSSLNVQIKNLTIAVDANGNPTTTALFTSTLNDNCQFVILGRAQNQTNPQTYPTGGSTIAFTENGGSITVNNITGLTSGDTWLLTVVAFG